jgi:hypothetical protein
MKYLRRFPYWYLLAIPALVWALGIASNQAVLVANHGKFPVMLNATWMVKMCTIPTMEQVGIDPDDEEMVAKYKQVVANIPASSCRKGGEMIDETHSVMGPNSHLKALSDIFPLGSIYSIGDAGIYLGEYLLGFSPIMWLALVIRKLYIGSAAE